MDAITELAGAAMGGVLEGRDCEACCGRGEVLVGVSRRLDANGCEITERYNPCKRCGGTGERRDEPLPLVVIGQCDYRQEYHG